MLVKMNKAKTEVFIQRSPAGLVYYEVAKGELRVSGKRNGSSYEVRYELQDLIPECEYIRAWYPLAWILPLALALVFIFVMRWMVALGGMVAYLSILLLPFIFVMLWRVVTGFAPFPVGCFRDTQGREAFQIVAGRGQERECDIFIESLTEEIRLAV